VCVELIGREVEIKNVVHIFKTEHVQLCYKNICGFCLKMCVDHNKSVQSSQILSLINNDEFDNSAISR
jgi:hypothetical protein